MASISSSLLLGSFLSFSWLIPSCPVMHVVFYLLFTRLAWLGLLLFLLLLLLLLLLFLLQSNQIINMWVLLSVSRA